MDFYQLRSSTLQTTPDGLELLVVYYLWKCSDKHTSYEVASGYGPKEAIWFEFVGVEERIREFAITGAESVWLGLEEMAELLRVRNEHSLLDLLVKDI